MYLDRYNYKIDGDVTYIFLKDEKDEDITVLIDTEDFPLILSSAYKIGCKWIPTTGRRYIARTEYLGMDDNGFSRNRSIYLHRLLMDYPDGMDVDHINHNPYDNRKSNLRIVERIHNARNRKGRNSNNTSGYRNVTYDKKTKKYIVQLQVDGKNKRLGKFSDVHEAGEFAEEMRKKYYGKFAGKN